MRTTTVAYTYKHGDRPLNGYTVQRAIGRGGFGEVYYALSDAGREVALKYLRDNPEIELRGVTACMNLKSPHLVQIFDVQRNADGEYFIIMEHVAGPSLRDLLVADSNGMGPQKAAFFFREIGKGLAYLHDRGIVHRDLKPGNIFYEDGYVKIGDYGLSKFISVSRHSAQTASVGTVHYMAPEVGSGNYSRGIDIYALGVMLYEMLMGKVPFEGGSMGEVLMKHLTAQPEVDALPRPFGEVIRKSLAKDPNDRYQTVDEMAEALLEVSAVRESIAGLDTASLSRVAQQAVGDAIPSPMPSPNALRSPVAAPPPPPPPVPQAHQQPHYPPPPAVPYGVPVGRPMPPGYAAQTANPAELSREAASGYIRYAGFWIRVAAALIDMVIVGAASSLIGLPFIFATGQNAMFPVASIVYSGLLIGRWNGQTLGKKACGIKVISADGRPCGQWQAFARAFADILNMFTLCFSYLMVAFSDRKRGLHDHIAGTVHVYALN